MWYPGHIKKAKEQIKKNLKSVDAIVELVDARIPSTSRAYEYDSLFGNKQKILILNKEDLADPKVTEQWVKEFKSNGTQVLVANLKSSDARKFLTKRVSPLIKSRFTEKRIMIIGMPNVGKSTFINSLKGKKSMAVGNRPGVTRGVQWITINETLMVMDTPGILYTRLHSPTIIAKLIAVGALPLENLQIEDVFVSVYDLLRRRYGESSGDKLDLSSEPMVFIRELCSKRNFILKGGDLDLERGITSFLKDLSLGRLGRFSFELPREIAELVPTQKT